MYLRRKIDVLLDDWLKNDDKTPALVVGIRQCGKTETIREFARRNKLNLIEMNFWTNPEYCLDFDSSLDSDTLISNISLHFPSVDFNDDNILLFFDEIQDCLRARLAFKSFKNDGKYRIIASGSYLGINGYVIGDSTPAPTGFEEVFQMKTMDYEEFLWALGYNENHIGVLIDLFNEKKPVPENIHNLYKDLFLKYACVGGFPKAVTKYLETKRIVDAFKVLENTIFDMKTDFGRRKDKKGNPVFKPSEVSRIQSVFDLIPTFLAKENKRFIVSKVSGSNQ